MKKKLLAILSFAIVMCIVMTGCSSGTSGSSSTSGSSEASSVQTASTASLLQGAPTEKVKIGFIGWSFTDTLGSSYKKYFDYMSGAFNIDYNLVTALTADDIVKQCENLIQAGCKAITSYIVTNSMMDMCDKAGVYLTQFGSPVTDTDLKAYLEKSKYWAGDSKVDDAEAAAKAIDALYDAGCRNIILCAPASGNVCHDLRFASAEEAVAKHSDMKVVTEYRNADYTTFGSAVDNALSVYPELDGVFSTCASNGAAESIIQELDTVGKTGKVKFATLDIIDKTEDYLNSGAITFIGGGQYPEVVFLTLAMYDKVNGKSTADGPVHLVGKFIYVEGVTGYQEYSKYISGSVFPFTIDELKSVVTTTNASATYEDMYKMWNNYNLDDVKTRHASLIQ